MKRFYLLFAVMMLGIMLSAQTQHGYVKTKGRLANDGSIISGQGLKGATVSIKGRTAVLVNADDGAFSFPVTETQFHVDSVRKKGYQLVDMDALSKTYKPSANPIYFVMETPTKQMEDQMEDFNRINASQQAMISQLRAEVKQLKAQNKINEEEYSRRLSEIAEMQSESQKLVSEMAERYSKMDFDQLDEFNRQVSWYIINGELIKADSLIKSKGSMAERSAELDNLHKANSEVRTDLEKSEQLEAKTLEEFATDCYNLFEICKLKHENDSAAYWLELRASKDTTNILWLEQAGLFIVDYLAQYDKALIYFNIALNQALQQNGEQSKLAADSYNNIGYVYDDQGEYDKSLEFYNKALTIRKTIFGENHPDIATSYNNIGAVYMSLHDYDKAMEYLQKALAIRKIVYGERHPEVASSYNNIATVFNKIGNYNQALDYHNHALSIWQNNYGENHPFVATSYSNIGWVYYQLDYYDNSLEYINKALTIRKAIFGENHPDVAKCYDKIGQIYGDLGDYNNALEFSNYALSIRANTYGESDPLVASSYTTIGLIIYKQQNYSKALEYLNKALYIYQSVYGEEHIKTSLAHYSIDCVEYQQVIAENRTKAFYEDHCIVATVVASNTPAGEQGMSGEYILLEYSDWNQNEPTSVYDKNNELKGKPKDILVWKDGIITQHHFEDVIGVNISIRSIEKQERQSINKAYEEWKKQNRK